MPLSSNRVHPLGETDYPWEREALDFIVEALPDRDPHHVWFLGGLPDEKVGRHHDLDAIVLGTHQIYLVEIKSRPGIYRGDSVDWRNDLDGEGTWYLDNPFNLVDHKSRRLGGKLKHAMRNQRAPYVQALVFLGAENTTLDLTADGMMGVVTRKTFARAITHGEFAGSDGRHLRRRVSRPMMDEVREAFGKIGLRPRRSRSAVGPYDLQELLEEGGGYREYRAVHRSMPAMHRRARVYLVPEQTDDEARKHLARAAQRDVESLNAVSAGPNILKLSDFQHDAAPGPTLLFEDFAEAQRLDAFLRNNPELSFEERAHLVTELGEALAYCHENNVIHGALNPQAVLVRKSGGAASPEVRLHNFQLGWGATVQATLHRTTLLGETGSAYQAPEVFGNPGAISQASDLFGLGALAYLIFTGRDPAPDGVALRHRLRENGCLDASEVTDRLDRPLVDHIIEATAAGPTDRANDWDVATWVTYLQDIVTTPTGGLEQQESDPLEAGPETKIGGFEILAHLGRGATSKVKKVRRLKDEAELALKISIDPEYDDRIRAEGRVLDQLRHHCIVGYEETLELGGRVCLLLRIAGDESLQQRLEREGPLSLADAKVLGSDLLNALESLELKGVLHRDIKTANIGLGAAYTGRRAQLTLFDFSAAGLPVTAVTVGTPGYRDPFVETRGAADASADRYSAAVVLHEMLTGERPSYDGSDLGPEPQLRLAEERFDPSARDSLKDFFDKALHPKASERFDSADEMRRAWAAALETTDHRQKAEQLGLAGVERIERDTPIAALDLLPRTKNALDRAGLSVAEDILRLPKNRLHAMRSVGAKVARDVLVFREKWLASLPSPESKPYYPDYRGRDLLTLDLFPGPMARALRYAGLHTLSSVANAHVGQIQTLAKRAEGFSLEELRDVMDREQGGSATSAIPETFEGWVDAFLAPGPSQKHPRALFGLDGPLAGRIGVSQLELARALGIKRQAVHQAVTKARERWTKHPAAEALVTLVDASVAALGGAGTLGDAGHRLFAEIEGEGEPTPLEPQAAALVRVALEILHEREDAAGLQLTKIRGVPFVCPAGLDAALRELGKKADELAERAVLAGPESALVVLREVVSQHAAGSSLEKLRGPRLIALATSIARNAARSAQLEIYPRNMSAARALAHTSVVLGQSPTRDDVIERVQRRYPEAERLPADQRLDGLMAELGFRYDPQNAVYRRASEGGASIVSTRSTSIQPVPSAHPGQPRLMTEEALGARAFDERLHIAHEQRRFCVLGVKYTRDHLARRRLLEQLGLEEVELDRLLLDEVHALCERDELDAADVWAADAAGPGSEEWPELLDLMREAAKNAIGRLLPAKAPTLLTQPGLIERFHLSDLLIALAGVGDVRAEVESEALFLLVPTYDGRGAPRINDRMPIPNVMGLSETIPTDWLENLHRGAASSERPRSN